MPSIRLPSHPSSVGLARRFVSRTLGELGCAELAEEASLLASELVTNALCHTGTGHTGTGHTGTGHTGTGCELEVRRAGGGIRIAVNDASPELPTRKDVSTYDETGRGLSIVAAFAAAWGSEAKEGEGKSVWFELLRAREDDLSST